MLLFNKRKKKPTPEIMALIHDKARSLMTCLPLIKPRLPKLTLRIKFSTNAFGGGTYSSHSMQISKGHYMALFVVLSHTTFHSVIVAIT